MPTQDPSRQDRASLLDCLYQRVGCTYLSDLKLPRYWQAERSALQRFPPQSFPPGDWEDALCYLTGERPPAQTAAKLRKLLLRRLARAPAHPDTPREKVSI